MTAISIALNSEPPRLGIPRRFSNSLARTAKGSSINEHYLHSLMQ